MNPSIFWNDLVNETMVRSKVPHAEACRLAQQRHCEVAVLARAYGKTRQSVAFFNARPGAEETTASRGTFQGKVQARMQEVKCDYTSAFNYVQTRHPELLVNKDVARAF